MGDPLAAFIEAACVPLGSSHASGTIAGAEVILAAHPEIVRSLYAAAILGDVGAVRRLVALDGANATAKGGPRGWDPLTYLCFSNYLKLDPARSDGFVQTAKALLDAGASANTGFYSDGELESAIYGAAGVAHHAELVRLLLERGADPNDGETPYHAAETHDNGVLKVLLESGKLNEDSLGTLLLRKADWHDHDGVKLLLEHGADPSRMTRWGYTALHQAVRRDNALATIELLLNHGADPTIPAHGRPAIAMAARRGRADILELLERRGTPIALEGPERLIAACARHDVASIGAIKESGPASVGEVLAEGGKLLAEFAGAGNTEGVSDLLDLGVEAGALFTEGDGYWGVASNSTALHVAAWRARHTTVKRLIERGAPVDAPDGKGRTPLALAVRACVDSYWADRRSPESVDALLRAGASTKGVSFPTGYTEVDNLLKAHGTSSQ